MAALHEVRDMERLINRIVYKNANCPDLLSLGESLRQLPILMNILQGASSKLLSSCAARLDTLDDVCKIIDDNINSNAPASLSKEGQTKSLTGFIIWCRTVNP